MNAARMKDVDVMTVDREGLVDILSIDIDISKPKNERIIEFIQKIKNPYCFKCGDTIVSVGFSDTDRTMEDGLVQYFKGKIV